MRLIFEKSRKGRKGFDIPRSEVTWEQELQKKYKRKTRPSLPEVSEFDVVRHFTGLARLNFSVDSHFYPLGSCTMKYNPKFTEKVTELEGFRNLHPLVPQLRGGGMLCQGALEIIYRLERVLCEITGMNSFTMQPLAGAHGELTGVMLIAAYHRKKGNDKKYIIIPDSSHGTNPASAAIGGYEVIVIPSDKEGYMDLKIFKEKLSQEVAGVMLTCPNTLGLFNPYIKEICDLTHNVDALMYYDGANLNAILGKVKPGDIGFDIVHLNLHKTFGTPHGGGGPGAGPIGVKKHLKRFLPVSRIVMRNDGTYALDYNYPDSIGYIAPFYGNFGVLLKAYAYILILGREGLIDAAEKAVLNANYLRQRLKKYFPLPYDKVCMHECVFSAGETNGITAVDIAKYLISKDIHPPTVYFPLIVKEAMMIEPTETESKDTLDNFVEVMAEIAALAGEKPDAVKNAPVNTPVQRPDEVKANRELDLRWNEK
jgi:glycine dehydrogenase subunit 2